MLQAQINYWNLVESKRHNISTETETVRHNTAVEQETHRTNVVYEQETVRHNKETEAISWANLNELKRSNRTKESLAERQWVENMIIQRRETAALEQRVKNETASTAANIEYLNQQVKYLQTQAFASRLQAEASWQNAQTNKGQLDVAQRNAATAEWNARINEYNAETQRLNQQSQAAYNTAKAAQGWTSIAQTNTDLQRKQAEYELRVRQQTFNEKLGIASLVEESISDAWRNVNGTLGVVTKLTSTPATVATQIEDASYVDRLWESMKDLPTVP